MMNESYEGADDLIAMLIEHGVLTAVTDEEREQIADELFDNGVLNGNWDSSTEVQGIWIRYIQEDEYDQSMDEDEDKPEWDAMLGQAMYGYVWVTK